MYILWRYLGLIFLKTFTLSVSTFILVLLVSRFKEIARFAALSYSLEKTALFIATQIPLILPIAIPLSALIAALLLFQNLSRTQELTAIRASGVSLSSLLAPILLIGFFLSFLSFFLCAEIAPLCRRESKLLLYHETSENPLLLLQRQHLVKLKNSYIKMKVEEEGKSAKDLVLITHNASNHRLSLVTAKKLRMTESELLGQEVAIVTHLEEDGERGFDPLIIENQALMSTDGSSLSSSLKKNRPRLDPSTFEFSLLRIARETKAKWNKKAFVEMLRRCDLSLAIFSFTFLGCAFGIEQGRFPTKKNLLLAMGLTLFLMLSYLLGKEFKSKPFLAMIVFFSPHPLIWLLSMKRLQQISKGI